MLNSKLGLLTGIILAACISTPAYANLDVSKTSVDDTIITSKIKAKMLTEKDLPSTNISVNTQNGVVTLSGKVANNTEASTAVQLASSTDGVKKVDASTLAVNAKDTHALSDALITAKVKGALIREKIFGEKSLSNSNIMVATQNGVVTLSGDVTSSAQGKSAVNIAKSVDGVKTVKSTLKVVKVVSEKK